MSCRCVRVGSIRSMGLWPVGWHRSGLVVGWLGGSANTASTALLLLTPTPLPHLHQAHTQPPNPLHQRKQYADTTRCSYLEGEGPEGLGPLRYVALYQSADAGRGRAVYCLLMPATGRGMVVVVQPSALAVREVRGRLFFPVI